MRDEILANWDDLFRVKTPPLPPTPPPIEKSENDEILEAESSEDELLDLPLEIENQRCTQEPCVC